MTVRGSASLLTILSLGWIFPAAGQQVPPEQVEFFEKQIRPIFAERCQGCHNSKARTAGLDLSTAAGFRKGADTGPVVVPGDLEASRLLHVISYQERTKMPPSGKLKDDEIAALQAWVKAGAPWPAAENAGTATEATKKKGYTKGQKEFWSFRPLRPVTPPAVKNSGWVRSPVDQFILARLEAAQLQPAPPADKRVLIRRATLDLTGLPPTEDEIRAFVDDKSPQAFEKLVDRLLASPRYGERWGRHWMDVARYADSTGADEDYRYPHAWRYRDYVIKAFNNDLPFNQFIREQIAGDLLPAPGKDVNTDGIVATGFLALGPKLVAEQDKVKMFYDIVDEQIEVTSKAFLGLSIACARCHDHKFDPISTKDYYSLASIFASTKQLSQIEGTVSKLYFAPLAPKDIAARYEAHQKKIEEKQKEIDAVVGAEARRQRERLAPRMAEYMLAAREVYEGGADVKKLAAERSLDEAVLDRWAKYLKPTKERRVHLEPWYDADAASVKDAARRYQEEYISVAAYRQKAQEDWKVASEAAKARGEKPPPAPRFLAGDNRFFTEVGAAKGPLGLPEKEPEQIFTEESRQKWTALKAELKTIKESGPPEPPFACSVAEGEPVEQHVFHRGNPDAKGDLVPKAFPVILAGEQQPPIKEGSGRRELAEWIASAENPLPARVMVNRIWQGHFGQGIVRTPNNFGIVGERPTHPELLEWLAGEFVANGWSVKKMHRLIMLSNAYQMSSEMSDEKHQKDPENRLFSRFSMRRLSVEEIRDSLLQLDGTIDFTMGGALQGGEGTDNEFSDARKSLHPDKTKRRTVYLPLRRSNLATLLTLFDFGDGTTSTDIRSETNVAPQALFMMNSNFVAERSRSLAEKLLKTDTSDTDRVARAWWGVLGREPEADEIKTAVSYIRNFPAKSTNDEARVLAWSSYCRALIASSDFIYVH